MDPDVLGENLLAAHNEALDRDTVKKLDWILLPFLALLFLFNSLDRSNVRFLPSPAEYIANSDRSEMPK
jgi:hypothetical protein